MPRRILSITTNALYSVHVPSLLHISSACVLWTVIDSRWVNPPQASPIHIWCGVILIPPTHPLLKCLSMSLYHFCGQEKTVMGKHVATLYIQSCIHVCGEKGRKESTSSNCQNSAPWSNIATCHSCPVHFMYQIHYIQINPYYGSCKLLVTLLWTILQPTH